MTTNINDPSHSHSHNHAQSHCTCAATGAVHYADCGCHIAREFLAEPTARYKASRRDFLRRAVAGGVTVVALPLLSEDAQADIFRPSVAEQKRMGEQAAAQVLQKYREVKDDRARNFSNIGAKLVDALPSSDRSKWDYRFHVIESKEINAFAVPGGNMFMFTGLMDRVKSDSELAAVTGHEMTHVRKEHWAKAVAGQQKRQLGLMAILGLAHAGAGWQQLAGIGESLYSLKFSRSEEDEADAGGLQDMVAAGFNPNGMLDLFHTLQTSSGSQGEPPSFLSDHPLTKDRIRRTQDRINRQYSNATNR